MGNKLTNPFAATQRTTSQPANGTTSSTLTTAHSDIRSTPTQTTARSDIRSTYTPTASQSDTLSTSTTVTAQIDIRSTFLSFFAPERLDTRETLRRLVTNRYIRGIDYGSKQFRFLTVFHQSSYSYCCCACAYEHEYVSYISDEGVINEEIYAKIVESVVNGYCPHVTKVSREYTRKTGIRALHIAAAVSSALNNEECYQHGSDRASEIFRVCPEELAMFSNNLKFVKKDFDNYKRWNVNSDIEIVAPTMHNAVRVPGDEYKVLFKYITQTEFCIRNNRRQLLQLLLDPFWTQSCLKSLEKCFVDPELSDMQSDIMDYLKIVRFQFRLVVLSECAISAIAYDDDLALKCFLEMLKSRKYSEDLTTELPNICDVLGKTRQRKILSEYSYRRRKMEDGDHFHLKMLHYLRQNHAENYFKQIKAEFGALSTKQKATINTVYNNMGGLTPLHNAVFNMKPREMEILLNMGADINIKNKHGETLLTQHLRKIEIWYVLNVKKFREVLAILICANPDIELNKSAIEDGIKMDEFFRKRVSSQTLKISGAYVLDGQEHSVFATENDYALNFIAPLLIECGFIYSRSTLLTALEKHLDPTELDYFRHCLDNPRSLQMSCRDTLRKHFKNCSIHKLVSRLAENIPGKIQNFILMKDVLTASQNFL